MAEVCQRKDGVAVHCRQIDAKEPIKNKIDPAFSLLLFEIPAYKTKDQDKTHKCKNVKIDNHQKPPFKDKDILTSKIRSQSILTRMQGAGKSCYL